MDKTMKISEIVQHLRTRFNEGLACGVDFRVRQLNTLKQMFLDNRQDLIDSFRLDYKKPVYEIHIEVDFVLASIDYTLKNLNNWMAPENVPKGFANLMNTAQIQKEPLGVVLIISPWNYPILLPMCALIGAIAAGNCAVLKPSEISPNISLKLQQLIEQYMGNSHYACVCGGVDVSTELLREKFDQIFFIGSEKVGKIVLEAAAKHLTPVSLELGGKCPCYVDKNCDLDLAAKKIAWAKTINAGQICISVDYVLCHQDVHEKLIELIKKYWKQFYGEDPSLSEDYGRIVNANHFRRIMDLINNSKGTVEVGAEANEFECYISPTIVTNVAEDDSLMSEEIFGPILPVVKVENFQEAVIWIQKLPKPLVVYALTTSNDVIEQLDNETSSGSLVINEIYLQLSIKDLPIGGVGNSGMGRYFGKETFNTFSNHKSYFRKKHYFHMGENIPLPPMNESKYSIMKWCF